MWIFKDGNECFSDGRASCRCSRWGRRCGRWILADFVAHLFGDITQGLRHRLAPLETLYGPVQEANTAEQQVRAVAQRHDGAWGVTVSSWGTSAVLFFCVVAWEYSCQRNKTKPNIREKHDWLLSSNHNQWLDLADVHLFHIGVQKVETPLKVCCHTKKSIFFLLVIRMSKLTLAS